jgi:propanol-preferring alcohol dehydrogenase
VELKGSTPEGKPEHLQAVIDMIASGDLTITAAPVTFDEIPDGLGRLARGEVTGRLYATFGEG